MSANRKKTELHLAHETSYLRKYALLAAILWCLTLSLSLFVNYRQHDRHLTDIGITVARSSFEKDILYRRWNASFGGLYVEASDQTIPNPFLRNPDRDIVLPSGKRLTMINPAYMTRQVHELGILNNGILGHITSLYPLRPENRPDQWEHQALQKLEQGLREVSSVETLYGEPYLRYMGALRTEQSCLKCHHQATDRVGHVRGGISQAVPLRLLKSTMAGSLAALWAGHVGILLLGLLIIWLAYRELYRRARILHESQAELLQLHQEVKLSQSKLLQSEKMASVGQLAAGVAHEINNPIGYISQNLKAMSKYVDKFASFIEAQKSALADIPEEDRQKIAELEKKLKLDYLLEDANDLIAESLDGTDRVQTIVRNLKTFSHVDKNDIQHLDLNECLDGTISIIWNELKYKATVEKDYGDLPSVSGYPQQISQIFMNLLINASHAIESQGIIRIHSWAKDNFVFVSITDNGCGISDENMQHIFEPFFTTKEVGKGTGLGLSMVYDIIKKHQGQICVQSTPGAGTTFTVQLPISKDGY